MKRWFAFLLLLVFAACQAIPPESPEPIEPVIPIDPLPPDGFLETWHKDQPLKRFIGADLYGHIDGGAEVFLELGFDQVVVQHYSGQAGEVVVEHYIMTDAEAALGVYLLHCGKEEHVPFLKARHTASLYQVQCVHGSAYIKINNPSGSVEAGDSLPAFAEYMLQCLPDSPLPGFFDSLPMQGRIAGSERVIRGPCTLERIYLLGSGDILQLGGKITAKSASYKDETGERFSRIQVDYDSAEATQAALLNVKQHLDPYLEEISESDRHLTFKDYAAKFGKIEVEGSRLNATVGLQEAP
ncbi:MAG: hypothetical protein KJ645_09075 [Planctomycetes bacterium]|nr:hypothetical protein [Planctomycetota bacterium]